MAEADLHVLVEAEGLTPSQRLFAAHFLRFKNATQAAIASGYSPTSAETTGSNLRNHPDVAAVIDKTEKKLLARVMKETQVTLERTVTEIAKGAFFDPRNFFRPDGTMKPVHELDDVTAAALAGFEVTEIYGSTDGNKAAIGVTTKIKITDRRGYLDMLMQHLDGYSKDKESASRPVADLLREFFAALHSGDKPGLPITRREPTPTATMVPLTSRQPVIAAPLVSGPLNGS